MAEVAVHYDRGTRSLVVWFGDPAHEVECEHTDSDVIVMLDAQGKAIGIQVLEYQPREGPLRVSVDQVDTSRARQHAGA